MKDWAMLEVSRLSLPPSLEVSVKHFEIEFKMPCLLYLLLLVVGHSEIFLQAKHVKSIWDWQDFYGDRKHIHTHMDSRLSFSWCKFQLVKNPNNKKTPFHVSLLLVDKWQAFLNYWDWEGKEGIMIDQHILYNCLYLVSLG